MPKMEIMHPKGFQWASESDKEPEGEWIRITDPFLTMTLKGFTSKLNIESKLKGDRNG